MLKSVIGTPYSFLNYYHFFIFTDEKRLIKLIPSKYRRQALELLKQFDQRGNELTWNSDGIIFVDQISIPNSDIHILFPYLFKQKHPKNLSGFEDFLKKISEMGLDHLIVKASAYTRKNQKALSGGSTASSSVNWWYIG